VLQKAGIRFVKTERSKLPQQTRMAGSASSSGAATVGVVGVRTPPKIQVGGVRHPKKLKGNITPRLLSSKRVCETLISRQLLNALKDA